MIQQNIVDRSQHRIAGDGRARDRVHALAIHDGAALADELAIEGFFLRLGAVAGGLGKAVIADDDLGDHAVIVQLQLDVYVAGEALGGGIVAVAAHLIDGGSRLNAEASQRADGGTSLVDAANNRAAGDGRSGDGVNLALVLGQVNRQLLALELIHEGSFLGLGAKTGGLFEGSAAHIDAVEQAFVIRSHGDFHRAGKAGHSRGGDIADHFAVGVHAFVHGAFKVTNSHSAALANKLLGKRSVFLGLEAKAGGFVKVSILADLHVGHNARFIRDDIHLDRAGKALGRRGSSTGLALQLRIRLVERVNNRVGRDGRASNRVHAFYLIKGSSVGQQRLAHGHGLFRLQGGDAVFRAVMGEGQRQRRHHRDDRQHDPCGQLFVHRSLPPSSSSSLAERVRLSILCAPARSPCRRYSRMAVLDTNSPSLRRTGGTTLSLTPAFSHSARIYCASPRAN